MAERLPNHSKHRLVHKGALGRDTKLERISIGPLYEVVNDPLAARAPFQTCNPTIKKHAFEPRISTPVASHSTNAFEEPASYRNLPCPMLSRILLFPIRWLTHTVFPCPVDSVGSVEGMGLAFHPWRLSAGMVEGCRRLSSSEDLSEEEPTLISLP